MALEGDGTGYWNILSDRMRTHTRRVLAAEKENLRPHPIADERHRKMLGLARLYSETDDDTLAIATMRRGLRGTTPAMMDGKFGYEFASAELDGKRLIVRGRQPPDSADKMPNGLIEVAFLRIRSRWRLDVPATEAVVARWLRSIPLPRPFDTGEHLATLAFSPSGEEVAALGNTGIYLLPFDGPGNPRFVAAPRAESIVFAPDGTWFAAGYEDGAALWHFPSLELWKTICRPSSDRLAVSPDGQYLATIMAEGKPHPGLWLWNVASGAGHRVPTDEAKVLRCAFLDDAHIVARLDSGVVAVHALAGERTGGFFPGSPSYEAALALFPLGGGNALIAVCDQHEQNVVVRELATGRERMRIPHGSGEEVRFSPDGTQIATASVFTTDRYDVRTGDLRRTHSEARGPFAWHPSGRWLVAPGQPSYATDDATESPSDSAHVLHVFRADD